MQARVLYDHDKNFHAGMALYEQGCDAPRETSPVYTGWKAAEAMAKLKSEWLTASRRQFGVEE